MSVKNDDIREMLGSDDDRSKSDSHMYQHQLDELSRKSEKNSKTAASEVVHPTHYNQGNIEVIDFIRDQRLDFFLGNALKYICRSRYKGCYKQDLQKAVWYLQSEIDNTIDAGRGFSNGGR